MSQPQVVMTTHDDWIVNVLLDDGRFYSFWTEMWPVHGTSDNMPAAVAVAKREALFLAERNAETWGLDAIPDTEEQFVKALNFVCMHADDDTFRRYMRG